MSERGRLGYADKFALRPLAPASPFRENLLRADYPFAAKFYAVHGISEGVWQHFPLLRLGKDGAHHVSQIDHHVIRGASGVQPVKDFLGA